MGWYEKIIRITAELALIIIFSIISPKTFLEITLVVVFVHSLFFLFNSNIICLVREIIDINADGGEYYYFIKKISYLFGKNDIAGVFISGSFARKEFKKNSDIDLRIIIEKNILKALKAYLFVSWLRFYAIVNRFPLDVYFFTLYEASQRLKPNEKIIILYDPKKNIAKNL